MRRSSRPSQILSFPSILSDDCHKMCNKINDCLLLFPPSTLSIYTNFCAVLCTPDCADSGVIDPPYGSFLWSPLLRTSSYLACKFERRDDRHFPDVQQTKNTLNLLKLYRINFDASRVLTAPNPRLSSTTLKAFIPKVEGRTLMC